MVKEMALLFEYTSERFLIVGEVYKIHKKIQLLILRIS